MSICKYCGEEKDLKKSHIIPRSFYFDYKKEPYRSYDINDKSWKICQNGVWDENILCSFCESKISQFDTEAYRVLFLERNKHKKEINTKSCIYLYTKEEFNYEKLRKFFISLVWRASITHKKEFEEVFLGKYENIALKIIKNEIEDDLKLFKTKVFKEPDNKQFNKGVFIKRIKKKNKIGYRFFFAPFVVEIMTTTKNINLQEYSKYEIGALNREEFVIIEDDSIYQNKIELLQKAIKIHKEPIRP